MKTPRAFALSVAMMFMLGPANGQVRVRPPDEPFQTWTADSPDEKLLDDLITEVVGIVEKGGYNADFKEWQSRDIRSEYRSLHLVVPKPLEGKYRGKNFLFSSDYFGKYFYTRFGRKKPRFFVPSACRLHAAPGKRVDRASITSEYSPTPADDVAVDREYHRLVRKRAILWEIYCGERVRVRFYDSHFLPVAEKQNPARPHVWVGVAIYYNHDDFRFQ